ncbi:MAG TPA: hypothetical protein DDY38_01670 [Firmicutes bacterium]|nr:hypothetical protein [Bacillota bacterium]
MAYNLSKSLGYPSFAAAKINIHSQSLTSQQDELKRKGVSKEHRPNPIIQMGLLMDAKDIPVLYDLFPGNTT